MRQLPRRESEPQSMLEGLFRRLRELAGRSEQEGGLREALEEIIEELDEEDERRFSEEERGILLNVLSFGELRVDDVMVPRTDICAVSVESGIDEVVRALRGAKHTRLIVYRDTLDDVVGILHVKDILEFWGDGVDFQLEKVVRPVLVVPPSMRVLDLLAEMRSSAMHIAVVVDEFGGTDGLVTVEDLVAEIVGDIGDEHGGLSAPLLVEHPDGTVEADGRVDLEDLERLLQVRLLEADERDEADTVAGLIFALLDRVPSRGEVVRHPGGLVFEVVDADPRRIRRVRIHRGEAASAATGHGSE
ncbi:hemolysin family protein [Marinimicrococcus flavescens]|uniref:Hemolysin family protein n=1 Tax=Marinimicrococcus flavescens TaxID=3031815 RepID=A0AAP3XQQ2_9PROT|nr:hemolysin family protein [Marinimicrococcus flavescens]